MLIITERTRQALDVADPYSAELRTALFKKVQGWGVQGPYVCGLLHFTMRLDWW